MNKLIFTTPGGSGINWLLGLIYCLENNTYMEKQLNHFHGCHKTKHACCNHNHNNLDTVFFNGTALFNIYLNVVKKFRIIDTKLDNDPITDQFEILASEASSKLRFADKKIDISYNNLITNTDKFIASLYQVLDQYNINYQKNDNIVNDAINKFKSTCVNPNDHFSKFDDVIWLGWSLGISKHVFNEILPKFHSIEQAQQFLYPKKDFYEEYTKDKVIFNAA